MLCLSGFELYSRWVPLPYGFTLSHETHENTTEASDHAPQVAEIFTGVL